MKSVWLSFKVSFISALGMVSSEPWKGHHSNYYAHHCICNCLFEKRYSYIALASYDLLWFLNRNPFRTDQNKWQISWEKKSGFVDSGFVNKCDWTLYYRSSMTLKNFRSPDEMERMLLHMGNNCARLREVHLFNCALR